MNTEKKIVDIGIDLFKQNGFDKTTIAAICEKAKISKGTFYYHFQNKNDIIHAYIDSFLADIVSVFPELLQLQSPKEQLWRLYQYSFEHVVSMQPNLLLAFYRADMDEHLKQLSPLSKNGYQFYTSAYTKMIYGLVKKSQELGEISKVCPAIDMIQAFNSAIVGIGLDWACKDGSYDEVEQLHKIFNVIFR